VLYNNNNILLCSSNDNRFLSPRNGYKWKKKILFILNAAGQAQKIPRVQRRLHARAQVHSTVNTLMLGIGVGSVRGGGTRECNDAAADGEWKGK